MWNLSCLVRFVTCIWNKVWDDFLIGMCHFKCSAEDYAVYYQTSSQNTPLWTLIWVDDVLWMGDPNDNKDAKRELGLWFPLKDLGTAHFFLGMKIARKLEEWKIILSLSQYIAFIRERFGFQNCYTLSTPMKPRAQLVLNPPTSDMKDKTLLHSILGSIMYLILCTRPDLAFTLGKLSKFSSNPSSIHMKALKRLLRYICKTRDHSLHFWPFDLTSKNTPYMFSNADWAGDKDKRRSTGAYICTIATCNPIDPIRQFPGPASHKLQ